MRSILIATLLCYYIAILGCVKTATTDIKEADSKATLNTKQDSKTHSKSNSNEMDSKNSINKNDKNTQSNTESNATQDTSTKSKL